MAAMVPFGAPLAFGAAALILVAQGSVAAAVAVAILGTDRALRGRPFRPPGR